MNNGHKNKYFRSFFDDLQIKELCTQLPVKPMPYYVYYCYIVEQDRSQLNSAISQNNKLDGYKLPIIYLSIILPNFLK